MIDECRHCGELTDLPSRGPRNEQFCKDCLRKASVGFTQTGRSRSHGAAFGLPEVFYQCWLCSIDDLRTALPSDASAQPNHLAQKHEIDNPHDTLAVIQEYDRISRPSDQSGLGEFGRA